MSRSASRQRSTKETTVAVTIDLDGTGRTEVSTGLPFYDHMLDQLGRHGGFDLSVVATGDLHVDSHHTVEDTAIVLGEAFREALGDKAGVRRFASGLYPLDEALVEVALDLSGRPFVVWEVELPEAIPLGTPPFDPSLAEHAITSLRHRRGHHPPRHPPAGPQRPPHHRGQRSRAWPAACATPCASRAPACRAPRACCDGRPAARGRARLRHRQPALGPEGAGAHRRRRPSHRRSRASSPTPPASCCPASGAFGPVHGGAARRRARGCRPRCRRRRAGRSSASASACSCCSSAPRRTTGATGLGVIPGSRALDPARREAAADAVEHVAAATTGRSAVRRSRTRAVDVLRPLPARRARRCRRRWRRRASTAPSSPPRSARATCSPRSSTRRSRGPPAWSCWPTSRAWRPGSSAPERPAMIELYPAIDLRGGRCVRLHQGDYEQETVYGDDPVAVARRVRGSRRPVDPRRRPRRRPLGRAGEPRRGGRHRRCGGRPRGAGPERGRRAVGGRRRGAGRRRRGPGRDRHRRAGGPGARRAASPLASPPRSGSTVAAARSPSAGWLEGSGRLRARRAAPLRGRRRRRGGRHRDRPRRHARRARPRRPGRGRWTARACP